MRTIAKNTMFEIEDFINEHDIKKEQVINIFQTNDGTFILNYFENA